MPKESWLTQEKRENSLNGIKDHFLLALPASDFSQEAWIKKVNQAWADGSAFVDEQTFFHFFDHIDFVKAVGMAEGLVAVPQPKTEAVKLMAKDLEPAIQYTHDKEIQVSAMVGSVEGNVLPLCSENYSTSDVFTTQSVTKIFTGVLAIRLLQEGIISEEDLNKLPIKIADSTKALLNAHAPLVREQMKTATLHQALTHYAGLGVGEDVGFGEYYSNYVAAIKLSIEENRATPKISSVEDFIPFIDNAVLPLGNVEKAENRHYSNSGIVLAALSLEHLYNQYRLAHPETNLAELDFDGIMKKYVTGPDAANMTCFEASSKSPNLKANGIARDMVGSPGGGYFSTAEDLQKFAQWMSLKCKDKDHQFVQLIEQYGQEFCPYPQSKTIEHSGDGPSSSAFFSLNWETGNVVIVLNDQRAIAASEVGRQIKDHLLASKPSAAELFHPSTRELKPDSDSDAHNFRYF